jgi:hypothetical protein
MWSAPANSRPEDVRVFAMIVAKLKFRYVPRHVFLTDLVERADHTALDDRPETLKSVRVNGSDNVLMRGMAHGPVWVVSVLLIPPLKGEGAEAACGRR